MRRLWIGAIVFGFTAAVVYFASVAGFAYPGESAALLAYLHGLGDASSPAAHPLFLRIARLFGGGNLLAPALGAAASALIFALTAVFIHSRSDGEGMPQRRERHALFAAGTAAIVFLFTPAVRAAATHLEPRLFVFVWTVFGLALTVPFARLAWLPLWLLPPLLAVHCALGVFDGALVTLFTPVNAFVLWRLAAARGKRPAVFTGWYVALTVLAFVIALRVSDRTFAGFLLAANREVAEWCTKPGWVFIALFSVMPFAVAVLAARRSLAGEEGFVSVFTHVSLTLFTILAVGSAFSPTKLMLRYGILPVFSSALAAATAGYLIVHWWRRRRSAIAVVSGALLAFVLTVSSVWNLFTFDGEAGAFADRLAERVLDDLGARRYLVTDGVLDTHLKLTAAKRRQPLELISLNRDLDRGYLEELSALVAREKIGGEKNAQLVLTAKLGVLPFLNDWFAGDASVKTNVAVWGAPDLWYAAGLKPVPELLFFGADERIEPDWSRWQELDALLTVPKGWGSYRDRGETDPVERLRHSLRRHVGLVANDRGVYLQDRGDNDAAWKMYELVLGRIDRDNICAIFNEVTMIGVDHPSAVAKRRDLERMLKTAVDDSKRRYLLWRLGTYYGYIRDPGVFIDLGHGWARSGRPGDALAQVRRAIDIVPDDRRASLMNLMASLYASDDDRAASRRIFEELLRKDAKDHSALVGMMRLELKEGNYDRAIGYLDRAVKAAGDGRQAKLDAAMLALMKNELKEAKQGFRQLVADDAKDLRSWSMLAAVTIQQVDAAKDEALKKKLTAELENDILPAMERAGAASENYYVQAVKGFLLLRKGAEKRREAREAFLAAAKARPDVAATQELVIGLDISLGDRINAETHARDILRNNRNAPLANYVMGSIALGDGRFAEAEVYLRKAADAPQPPPLAFNDLAETLRRLKRLDEAEYYARKTVKTAPKLAAAWDTLGAVLLDAGKELDEAEAAIKRACELSKSAEGGDGDIRMLISLARVHLVRGDKSQARVIMRKVLPHLDRLAEFERGEFEAIRNDVK